MPFNTGKFLQALMLTVLVGVLVLAAIIKFSGINFGGAEPDPAALATEARAALEAVRVRQPGDRRPASYDAVLAPLDKLLAQARDLVHNIEYDPVADYQKLFDLTDPVIKIATDAQQQAMTETGPLAKDFRFGAQKAEACQYLASGMWSRSTAQRAKAPRAAEGPTLPPEGEVNAVLKVINDGLDADPQNYSLWYMRGIISRDNGMFAAAARDLEKALEINPEDGNAWNVLGLVRINLKQFDKAEEALEKAKSVILAKSAADGVKPGEEYTSAIYNLARFHEGLATFYARENRITPSPENQRLLAKHASVARKYFQEFLEREPADSQDARLAKRLLDGLPG